MVLFGFLIFHGKLDWFKHPYVKFSDSVDRPMGCRVLFEEQWFWESAIGLEARLVLWDRTYEKVGCLRSQKEEQSQADLISILTFNEKPAEPLSRESGQR